MLAIGPSRWRHSEANRLQGPAGQDLIEIYDFHYFGDLERNRRERRKDPPLQTQGLIVVRARAEEAMCDLRPVISKVCRTRIDRRGDAP